MLGGWGGPVAAPMCLLQAVGVCAMQIRGWSSSRGTGRDGRDGTSFYSMI
jgi:hypothetical protein